MSTTPITCLMTVGTNGPRRKLFLSEANLCCLKAAGRDCELFAADIDFDRDRFQVFDKDFNEFVDLMDMDVIPDKSVVRVLPKVELVPAESGAHQHAFDEMSTEAAHARAESSQSFAITTSLEDDDGKAFVLPELSFLAGATSTQLGAYATTKIVDAIFQAMVKNTIYPSRKFYQKVGSILVQAYPQLRDSCGSGHDSWVLMIRQKFKNERRKLCSSRVTESRQRFGAAAKRLSTSTEKNVIKKGKVGQKLAQNLPPCTEDLASIAAHEAWLLAEMGKPQPDTDQIRCRLELSHSSRVKQLSQTPVAAALERYPYLMDIEWFLHDFNSLIKKDGEKAIEHGFSQVLGLAVGGALGARKKDVSPLLEVFDPEMSARRKKHIQTVRTLCLLAKLLNQPTAVEALFVPMEEEEDRPPTPCVIYSGTSAEEAIDMFLSVEGVKMARVIDGTQGITAIMAAYWLFDLSYAPMTHNLCCVVEHLFLDIAVTKPKCVVQRFIAAQKTAVFPASMDV